MTTLMSPQVAPNHEVARNKTDHLSFSFGDNNCKLENLLVSQLKGTRDLPSLQDCQREESHVNRPVMNFTRSYAAFAYPLILLYLEHVLSDVILHRMTYANPSA